MDSIHKIVTTEDEITICKLPVLEEMPITQDWFKVTCSECAKRRPESVTWVPESKAFEKDDDE